MSNQPNQFIDPLCATMSQAEKDYFDNIIRFCEKQINMTSDPACVAANARAIKALKGATYADPLCPSVELEGIEVDICRADDGTLVVTINGPGDNDCTALGSPDIRVWLNDALIYAHGETGDDLAFTPEPVESVGSSAKPGIVVNPDPRAITKKYEGDRS